MSDLNKLTDEISSDIAEYAPLDTTSDIESAQQSIDKYISLSRESADSSLSAESRENEIFSQDKAYIYYVAFNFYKELIKQAKRFNKAYCKIHGMILSGQRELKNKGIGQKYNKEFNPFLYKMYIRSKDAADTEKKLLTSGNATPEEAALKVAYALGFLDSYEYKSIPQMFHIPTIEKILSNDKWLDAVRKHSQYTEEIKQIRNSFFVNKERRDSWMEEVQNKLQEEVYKMKGAL